MPELVLITGPVGFVGFKTMLTALEVGYAVRAVIRKPEQAEKLKSHAKLAPFADQVEFVVVPDLTQKGAFDDKLDGVVAILHVASPLAIESDDYDRDILTPAVEINLSILSSAVKCPAIRKIVFTSSLVSIVPFEWYMTPDSKHLYSAKDINVNPGRKVSSNFEAYWNSKALSRQAVRDFMTVNRPHFETVQILPSVIIGPDDRATSVSDLKKNTPDWEMRLSPLFGVTQAFYIPGVPIDVADVARAQVDAIKPSIPGNSEYILSANAPEGMQWDSMIDLAKKLWPGRAGSADIPLGGSLPTLTWWVDVSETEKAFGWKPRGFEEMIGAQVGQYLKFVDAEKE